MKYIVRHALIRKTLISYVMFARALLGQGADADPHGSSSEASGRSISTADDRKTLIAQLEAVKEIQKHWPGEKVFLDAEYGANPQMTDFKRRFIAISARYGIDPPDVIIVKPPLDKQGQRKPQLANGTVAWGVVDGKFRNVILTTEYQKNGLTESEFLAHLAHEMGHVSQYQKNGHNPHAGGRNMEAEADQLALSCPEVDPAAFESWLLKTEKLNDAVTKKHPLLAGDFTGSTAIIPDSVQTRLQDTLHVPFVGGHTRTSTRIKWAHEEAQKRRAEAVPTRVPQILSRSVKSAYSGGPRR